MEVGSISQGGQFGISVGMLPHNEVFQKQAMDKIAEAEEAKIREKDLKNAVEEINVLLQDKRTHIEYDVHKEFHQIMLKVVDDETNEVVQELPPRKVLDVVAKLCEMAGILVDEKV